jgi:antitoxin YefM
MNNVISIQDFNTASKNIDIKSCIQQVNKSKESLIFTENGKNISVLLNFNEFENMREKIQLLEDINTSILQINSGDGLSNSSAKQKVFDAINKCN